MLKHCAMNRLLLILICISFISLRIKADDDDSASDESSDATTTAPQTDNWRAPQLESESSEESTIASEAIAVDSESSEEAVIETTQATASTVDDVITTQYVPTNAELCDCFDFELICNPFIDDDEICYYYKVKLLSTASYCTELESIVFHRGRDASECGVTYDSDNDIDTLLSSYSPQCYSLSMHNKGLSINLNSADNYYLNFGSESSSLSFSDSLSSVDASDAISSESSLSSDASVDEEYVEEISLPDFILFSVCFDAESGVSGTQDIGKVFFYFDDQKAKCKYSDTLPDFCGAETTSIPTTSTPTTIEPTSSAPTTSSPTTLDPTTLEPTTAAPTTSDPTTSSPTTLEPTTAEPTTSSPTTASPTTSAPTTTAPTTAEPTTSSPTTLEPTTAEPTTASPTTQEPTTLAPTTSTPTISPTFDQCMTNDSLNIAFLLDESGSVSSREWKDLIAFVDRIIQFDLAPTSYVSLFEFASIASYTQFLDWTHVGTNRSVFTDALDDNPYNNAGQTYTWDAVSRVLDEFWDYKFTCTDGCQYRADMLFLITDGAPSDTVCPDIIERVNNTDIDIVIIGIGENVANWSTQVSCLDARDGENDIYTVPEFDTDAFNAIESRIRDKTCNGLHNGIPDSRPLNGTQWRYNGSIGLGPLPTRSGGGGNGSHDPLFANVYKEVYNGESLEKVHVSGTTISYGVIGGVFAALLLLFLAVFKIFNYIKKKGKHIQQLDVCEKTEIDADGEENVESNDVEANIDADGLQVSQELNVEVV